MNNKPVAWIDKNTGKPRMEGFIQTDYDIPLYTHPAEHDLGIAEAIGFEKGHEAGRQLGMKQERALWNLSESTQEIMNAHPVSQYKAITNTKIEPTVVSYTHPVKELTDEEIEECCCFLDVRLHHRYEPNAVVKDIEWTVTGIKDFVEAVLRKAREK